MLLVFKLATNYTNQAKIWKLSGITDILATSRGIVLAIRPIKLSTTHYLSTGGISEKSRPKQNREGEAKERHDSSIPIPSNLGFPKSESSLGLRFGSPSIPSSTSPTGFGEFDFAILMLLRALLVRIRLI